MDFETVPDDVRGCDDHCARAVMCPLCANFKLVLNIIACCDSIP